MGRRGRRRYSNQVQPLNDDFHLPDPDKEYSHGERIGNESRWLEFKEAGGNLPLLINMSLGKYVCGFLNSGEEGTVMLGVQDSGCVSGVRCSHGEEDQLKLLIDKVMKGIYPPVFPDEYRVDFVPVVGTQPDYKVIEVRTRGKGPPDILYETDTGQDKGVFIRRDGSLQGPLKARDIQEWSKKRYQSHVAKAESQARQLRDELNKKEKVVQNISSKLQEQQDEINNLRKQAIERSNQETDTGIREELQEIRQMISQQGQPATLAAQSPDMAHDDSSPKKGKSKICVIS